MRISPSVWLLVVLPLLAGTGRVLADAARPAAVAVGTATGLVAATAEWVPASQVLSPKLVCRGLPEHMDIELRADNGGYVITDKAAVVPPAGYELWYMIDSEIVKTQSSLSNYVYASRMPLTIYKAMVRKGASNLYPANDGDPGLLSPFSHNCSIAFAAYVFSPVSAARGAVAWERLVPPGYDPSTGFVQWADEIEDMTLPSGKIWVSGRGHWPAEQMYRKGLTHLTKFDLVGLPPAEIDSWMKQGKAYDDVPQTPTQLSLQDKGSGEWVPKGKSWPDIWNTRFFPYREGQTEPLTKEEGAEKGRKYSTAYSMVIFENSEQDHAIGAQWPFWRSYYGEWIPRMEATWKPRGVQVYVGHNYFSGISPTVDWLQRGPAKELLRKPLSQWPPNPMLPGGTLEKSNLSCFGLYLGAPDMVKDFHYRLAFSAYANHKAGKTMIGFMQAVHEWRPNNFYENKLPDGVFYRPEKLPPAPGNVLGLVTLSFVFGDGLVPFGFGGKAETKKWVQHYAQGALWYPHGADKQADLNTFPYWCPESGGYYIGYSGVEDMAAFAVRAVNRTFFQVEGGDAKFLTFRLDGGPWIEARNAEADDIVDACYDKRGIVFSKSKGGRMAVLYINPFADNKQHLIEFKDADGRVYKAGVSTSAPHLALVVR